MIYQHNNCFWYIWVTACFTRTRLGSRTKMFTDNLFFHDLRVAANTVVLLAEMPAFVAPSGFAVIPKSKWKNGLMRMMTFYEMFIAAHESQN